MANHNEEHLKGRKAEKPKDTGVLPSIAYLSLGSNLGDRESQLREAVNRLSVMGRVAAVSPFYETEPVEFAEQPWFLNCAVALETRLTPLDLMSALLRIEKQMGRQRVQNKGPRSIDIDILLFNDVVLKSALLTIPHPAMQQRRFVLEPLAEIAPLARHPLFHKTVVKLRDALPVGQIVRKIKSESKF
jgi:2-amino-4-hydroxy-6-hydroxymethyldihydropteridine diphosphokinase